MDNLPSISTFPAVEFVCEECGRNSYASLISLEKILTKDELDDLYMKLHGVPAPAEGCRAMWLMHPKVVTCGYCGQQYATYQQIMEDGCAAPDADDN